MNQLSEEQPNWNIQASDDLLANWPIRDVLVALTRAATHLLTDHDCDAHGYEELQHAVVAARRHADLLDSAAEEIPDDLPYRIVEKMGLGLTFRSCACGQLPCARLRPLRDALETVRRDAATLMRDKCVEKVKELRDQHNRDYEYWKSIASDPDRDFGVLKFAAWAGEDERVISALESLTLDQSKLGEM